MIDKELWSLSDLAAWLDMEPAEVGRDVITQEDFPRPFRPTGKPRGRMRWFREDVVQFYRKKAA